MNFAGLDVGTTGVKAIVVNGKGEVMASAYQNYPLLTPHEGWCELDPDAIWEASKKVLSEVASVPGGFESIAVSSHAQAVVPIDKMGRTLYPFISTVDTRTKAELDYWRLNHDEWRLYQRTGLPFSAIYTVNKILWLRSNRPDVFSQAVRFLCVQDFLNWKLTGRAAIDYSLASRGMLFNVREKKWDEEILEIAGLKPEMLSELVPSGEMVGRIKPELAQELRLDRTVAVISGAHDQTCGCLGSGTLEPGQVMNATGTVEVLQAVLPQFISDPQILSYHFPCTPYIAGGRYLTMSINNSGGLMLQWYMDMFCGAEKREADIQGINPYTYVLNRGSEKISNVYFLPHLNGAETPIQDPDSACAIVHLRANTTKADITRGLIDSMAYELQMNLEALRGLGVQVKEIRAIGGGARSDRMLQAKADVSQLPVLRLPVKESSALGAAMIGAVGVGAFESFESAVREMVRPGEVFEPNRELKEEYSEHFEEYKMLYPSLARFNSRVSERAKREIEA